MAKEDIFEKEYVDERDKNNLEGLLEQLNLPPAAVKFVRENKRLVQAAVAGLVILIVGWSLYDSYRDGRIEKSSEALFAAQELSGQEMLDKLAEVEKEYGGTDAALWARINAAQEFMENSQMSEAQQKFKELRDDIKPSSPLWPLVSVGIAQSAEAAGNFDEAVNEYGALMEVEGYKDIGFLGSARLRELQGNREQALELYEQYLTELDPSDALQRVMVEEKIARIKAAQ
ncbi:MAG: tetratricopeptide repeat protein [Desulfofustis sp.]|jgi:predicted negative regulator of RcsB-dependent stress response